MGESLRLFAGGAVLIEEPLCKKGVWFGIKGVGFLLGWVGWEGSGRVGEFLGGGVGSLGTGNGAIIGRLSRSEDSVGDDGLCCS